MNYINQAEKIFDNIEKWNAFLELSKIKNTLVSKWYDNLENAIKEKIETDFNKDGKWHSKRWGTNSYGWYLKEHNEGSLTILFEYNCFCLWINRDLFDINKITEEYKSCDLFINEIFKSNIINNDNYLKKISIQLFDTDSQDNDSFAWYLSKDNENLVEFTNKVYEFFSYFMGSADKTEMIREINLNCNK